MEARIGLITTDPYRIAEDLDSNEIEFFTLYGGKIPGQKTCFVTFDKVDEHYQEELKRHPSVDGFKVLATPSDVGEYIRLELAAYFFEVVKDKSI